MTVPALLERPPEAARVTDYDLAHKITYLRLLDADDDGADWSEAARLILGLDPTADPGRAKTIHTSHLARARWMTEHGYRDLLRRASAN